MRLLLIFILSMTTMLFGCLEKKSASTVKEEVLIPFLLECQNTINMAKNFLESISEGKNYTFGLTTEVFDQRVIPNDSVIGVVRLYSTGEWQGLDGSSSKEFLSLHASGIQADCFPDNSIRIDTTKTLSSSIDNLYGVYKNKVYLDYENDRLVLYFNDGSYSYNQEIE